VGKAPREKAKKIGTFMLRVLSALLIAATMIGCGKKGPEELTLEQVPEAIRKAFVTAKNSLVKTSAEGTAKLVEEKQYAAASLQLQALSANTDLTEEQRNVVAGATVAVNAALQELAASLQPAEVAESEGAPKAAAPPKEEAAAAAAVLEHYQRTK
jgi:predicted small lipoprotein YifL